MNEVFENNAAITSIRNFYMNYRKVILGIAVVLILIIFVFLINNQIYYYVVRARTYQLYLIFVVRGLCDGSY